MNIAARCALLTATLLAGACAQLPAGETVGPVGAVQPAADPIAAMAAPAAAPVPAPAATPPAFTATIRTQPRDVWERIRNGYAMQPMDNDLVRQWENFYSTKPEYFARMVDRSSHYLFHIIEEIERRKMPAEVALLPMIESAYNPQAYSKAHASGLWQFIPSTGKHYGLRQNWWYDGRRDVIAATGAALDYLQKLHAQFGDWELALASYNWGEGAVARAVARNQAKGLPGDYASLTMPAETRNYLPKLIAVKNIIADPARFGVKLASVPNQPYFEVVTVKRHIDVKLAAKFAEMPLDEFKFLNPAHNKQVIKAGSSETIVLPRDKVAIFNANFDNHDKPLVSWQAHTVKAGEKPEKIAAKYGMSVAELKQVNDIGGKNKFQPGQSLLVQATAGVTPNLPDLPATPVSLPKAYKAARSKNAKIAAKPGAKPAAKSAVAKRAPAKRPKAVAKAPAAKKPGTVVATRR
ncbi:MAG: transglycosylase SLT domain-containing protein [Burkholderiales bacterium]|nr:transglycosylase SLT domain-containing protein [Burkholderiales bacterium]